MSVPGFRAEATIYRSTIPYQAALASGEAAGSVANPVQLIPMLLCTPFCDECVSDVHSRTGCSQTCIAGNCNEFTTSCHGCANPCKDGRFCGGICKDTSNDPNNCGACFNVCPPGVPCRNGTCGCLPGQILCSGRCINTSSDPNNCGACGNVCGPGHTCQNGACVPGCLVSCAQWQLCNNQCGAWPPGASNAGCWLDCLKPPVNCLTSTCG
jgi:hypothetical protein